MEAVLGSLFFAAFVAEFSIFSSAGHALVPPMSTEELEATADIVVDIKVQSIINWSRVIDLSKKK